MASSSACNTQGGENPSENPDSNTQQYPIAMSNKRTASVWQHFTEYLFADGTRKAQCNICNKFYSTGGNSTLQRHYDKCVKNAETISERTQGQIDRSGKIWSYDPILQRELQHKLVIEKELPFNFFDDSKCTEYIQDGLQPKYRAVSRITMKRDAFKSYKKAKKELLERFKNFDGKISLTSDIWSSKHQDNDGYLCVTAHWMENWQLNKRIISFDLFEPPHNSFSIYSQIMFGVRDFKIKEKIFSITFDNATNNTASIPYFKNDLHPILDGTFFHVRCACHILNLIVKQGLTYVDPILRKIRYMYNFIYGSGKRRCDFKKFCHENNARYTRPKFDNNTRWNSTYLMLQDALNRKNILSSFYSTQCQHDLFDDDWATISKLLEILEVFYVATVNLSGTYYPTICNVLYHCFKITNMFNQFKAYEEWRPLIISMEEKFKKYYEKMPSSITCAAALNPLIKSIGVQALLTKIDGNLGIYDNQNYENFNRDFQALYNHYDITYGRDRSRAPSVSSSVATFVSDIQQTISQISGSSSFNTNEVSDLYLYSRTDFICTMSQEESENLDILQWWNKHSRQYTVLAAIARDLLTVQASTVASESCFSLSGRIIDEKRSRLSPESLEVCICYRDYLAAKRREQHTIDVESSSDDPDIEEEQEEAQGSTTNIAS